MEKPYTVTLTASEMLTLRAALTVYKENRRHQVDLAQDAKEPKLAEYFDHQRARASVLYEKVFYQHEDQCAA